MSSPALRNVRANSGVAFRARAWQTIDDTGLNTNEELDNSETDITMDADASSILSAGDVIHIEAEDMLVTSVVTVTVNVERGYANSDPVIHTTNQDVFMTNTAETVLWLPGQDDAQSSTIRDISGKKNHGALSNTTWLKNSKGLSYLDFNATTSVVNCGSASVLDNITPMTAIFWMAPDGAGEATQGVVFHKESLTGAGLNSGFFIVTDASQSLNFFQEHDGGSNLLRRSANGEIQYDGSWQRYVVTWDGGTAATGVKIYRNGAEVLSYRTSVNGTGSKKTDAVANLLIGATSAGANNFDGGMIGWRLETRVMALPEIRDGYRQERGLFGV